VNIFILIAAIIFFVWSLGGHLGNVNMLALGLGFWALGMAVSFVLGLPSWRNNRHG
jgi:hypothetical protein